MSFWCFCTKFILREKNRFLKAAVMADELDANSDDGALQGGGKFRRGGEVV